MSAVFVFPAVMVASAAIVGATALIASPIGKNRTASLEATERDTDARYEAEIKAGFDTAELAHDRYATAQACAQLVHAQTLGIPNGFVGATWAAELHARIGRHPDATDAQRALGFRAQTPRLTVAACLLHSLGLERDRLYAAGDTREGARVHALMGFTRPELIGTIDGGDRLLELIDAHEAQFCAGRRITSPVPGPGVLR